MASHLSLRSLLGKFPLDAKHASTQTAYMHAVEGADRVHGKSIVALEGINGRFRGVTFGFETIASARGWLKKHDRSLRPDRIRLDGPAISAGKEHRMLQSHLLRSLGNCSANW